MAQSEGDIFDTSKLDPYTQIVMEMRQLRSRVKRLETIVYGFCSLIVVAVVGTWIKLTIKP
jgi:hypothetical protein